MTVPLDTLNYKVFENGNWVDVMLIQNKLDIGHCKIDYDSDSLIITEWYINSEYRHRGLGRLLLDKTLKIVIQNLGYLPAKIEYIWNGKNEYVLDWLTKNFNAKDIGDLNQKKYSPADTWENHRYTLNRENFVKYFNLGHI